MTRGAYNLIVLTPLLLAGCEAAENVEGGGDDASLYVAALSADELVATVSATGDGTLACGSASHSVSAGNAYVYLAGLPPGETTLCTLTVGSASASAEVTPPEAVAPGSVVFDAGHGEQSGNADWVIDDDVPEPKPANPASREDWTGAYSSYGFDLYSLGYSLTTLTGSISESSLSGVQAIVLPEPNQSLEAGELTALTEFVLAGGGLVLITDHHDSDRDHDNVDSTDVADQIFEALGVGTRQASDLSDVDEDHNDSSAAGDPADPVTHGRGGTVKQVDFYDASAFTLSGLPGDRAVLWLDNHGGEDDLGARVVATYAGAGRVLSISDSAPADDGTGDPYDELYDSWEEANDAELYLNAVDWAAGVR